MKPYLISLAMGLVAGSLYGLFHVRSPAPPLIALVGLLGILAGEQIPPLVARLVQAKAPMADVAGRHLAGSPPAKADVSSTEPRGET